MAALGLLWIRARGSGGAPEAALSAPAESSPLAYEQREPGRGRMAERPPQVPALGWRDVLWRTWLEVGRDRLAATAAGVSFYMLLAIFPAIGAFVALWGLFADVGAVSAQLTELAAFVPFGVLEIIAQQMIRLATARPETLSFAFLFSLFLWLWSANAGMAALFDGLNVVYEEREKRNFLVRRVVTFAFTCAALLFVVVMTAILVAVPWALRLLGLGDSLLIPLRWLVMLAMGAVAIAVVYRYGPSRSHARWRWVAPGAVAAAVGWLGASLGFSWYINNVAHYDLTYGSLGAAVGLIVWIWVSVMCVLLGAEFDAELEHQTACDTTTGPPEPLGRRGAVMADTVGESFAGVRHEAGLVWAMLQRQAARARGRRYDAPPQGELPRSG
jgi:membrane protein